VGNLVSARRLFSSLTVRQNVQFPMREKSRNLEFLARRNGDGESWKWSALRRTTATSFPPNCPAA
jgi:ABC-type transporter Mla maintaining outer membrane lipid asymmetry ATPase subunit MlaF